MKTIRKILAATDLSDESQVAVERAAEIATRTGAELIVLHVGWMPERVETLPDRTYAAELVEYARAEVERHQDKLELLRDGLLAKHRLSPEIITREGFADETIREVADHLDVDLIVVGTRGRTGFRRFFLGSVAERVVRLSRRDVLVARPPRDSARDFERVLAAVDLSNHTAAAIEAAIALAGPRGRVELFHAVAVAGAWMAQDAWKNSAVRTRMLERARDQGTRLAARYADRAVTVSFDCADGPPAVAITERLDSGDYDLCVVGSHGRRGLDRFFIGSVANHVVRYAPCSVAVARMDRAAA